MTADAAPVLMKLAKTIDAKKYRVRALRGYIRIARQFVLPIQKRAAMCAEALGAAEQKAEKTLVLQVLQRYPSRATLRVALQARKDDALRPEATKTALAIAAALKKKGTDVAPLLQKAGLRLSD